MKTQQIGIDRVINLLGPKQTLKIYSPKPGRSKYSELIRDDQSRQEEAFGVLQALASKGRINQSNDGPFTLFELGDGKILYVTKANGDQVIVGYADSANQNQAAITVNKAA